MIIIIQKDTSFSFPTFQVIYTGYAGKLFVTKIHWNIPHMQAHGTH